MKWLKEKDKILRILEMWFRYNIIEDCEVEFEIISNSLKINVFQGLSEITVTCLPKRLIVMNRKNDWIEVSTYYEALNLVNYFILKDTLIDMLHYNHFDKDLYEEADNLKLELGCF